MQLALQIAGLEPPGCRASIQGTCMLDVLLFSEPVAPGDQLMPHLFPVNLLRCLVGRTPVGRLMLQNSGRTYQAAMHAL
jgi:hypothetical protein